MSSKAHALQTGGGWGYFIGSGQWGREGQSSCRAGAAGLLRAPDHSAWRGLSAHGLPPPS